MDLNGIIFQCFHWYSPSNGSHWRSLRKKIPSLAKAGVTALWLPPAFKACGGIHDVGYGTYDLYDLGEFDQKGTVRTKYGTKDEYLAVITRAKQKGIQVYADLVLNHKGGADETEKFMAQRVWNSDRNREIGSEVEIEAWTKFDFLGRNGQYSPFTWNWHHFDGVDWAQNLQENSIFKIIDEGKSWERLVDTANGNYDYLMYADIDFDHPEVQAELKKWSEWYVGFTGIDGFRLDAIKHIRFDFFKGWLDHIRQAAEKELFAVGEYWNPDDVEALHYYIAQSGGRMSLFDAPLHKNFFVASRTPWGGFDMRRILDNTLMRQQPALAVTLVENHDTQPLQALESTVDWWFKPLAYAIILLRKEGYPCVFFADYYGAKYNDFGKDGDRHSISMAPVSGLSQLMTARKKYAYGSQHDFFDHPDIIGWTREGDDQHPGSGLAVIMSNSQGGSKWMYIGYHHAGKEYVDLLDNVGGAVRINQDGWGKFRTESGAVSVWIESNETNNKI